MIVIQQIYGMNTKDHEEKRLINELIARYCYSLIAEHQQKTITFPVKDEDDFVVIELVENFDSTIMVEGKNANKQTHPSSSSSCMLF